MGELQAPTPHASGSPSTQLNHSTLLAPQQGTLPQRSSTIPLFSHRSRELSLNAVQPFHSSRTAAGNSPSTQFNHSTLLAPQQGTLPQRSSTIPLFSHRSRELSLNAVQPFHSSRTAAGNSPSTQFNHSTLLAPQQGTLPQRSSTIPLFSHRSRELSLNAVQPFHSSRTAAGNSPSTQFNHSTLLAPQQGTLPQRSSTIPLFSHRSRELSLNAVQPFHSSRTAAGNSPSTQFNHSTLLAPQQGTLPQRSSTIPLFSHRSRELSLNAVQPFHSSRTAAGNSPSTQFNHSTLLAPQQGTLPQHSSTIPLFSHRSRELSLNAVQPFHSSRTAAGNSLNAVQPFHSSRTAAGNSPSTQFNHSTLLAPQQGTLPQRSSTIPLFSHCSRELLVHARSVSYWT